MFAVEARGWAKKLRRSAAKLRRFAAKLRRSAAKLRTFAEKLDRFWAKLSPFAPKLSRFAAVAGRVFQKPVILSGTPRGLWRRKSGWARVGRRAVEGPRRRRTGQAVAGPWARAF